MCRYRVAGGRLLHADLSVTPLDDARTLPRELAKDDGSVVLTHVFQVRNEEAGTCKASYLVLPIWNETLTQGFQTLTDPQGISASPQGWHSDGTTSTTTTAGNNAIAFKGSQSSATSQSSSGLVFNYSANANASPTTTANVNAACVNAFYIVNSNHDNTYKYGFTEAAFNSQNNIFGKGGKGDDRVTVSVQDSAATDNADFATPPDGQSGAMRMFMWNYTNPQRDGALENDIVSHENTHGLSKRLTGGGSGRCLQNNEAGGLGEGWSDAFADWLEETDSSVPDYVMGQYVINDPAGIRSHPYSTSASVNPLRYSVEQLNEVHNNGEVCTNTLHNVYAARAKNCLLFLRICIQSPRTYSRRQLRLLHDVLCVKDDYMCFLKAAQDVVILALSHGVKNGEGEEMSIGECHKGKVHTEEYAEDVEMNGADQEHEDTGEFELSKQRSTYKSLP
ncbi:peptidase M36 [Trametes cingulata]|nr:peptidase M36 [Trametes cingulata]